MVQNSSTPQITSYGKGNVSLRSRTHRYIQYEDGSKELYDMVKDPNEWKNLAGDASQTERIARFQAAIPKHQAPLSKVSTYDINAYWRDEVKKNHSKPSD